MELNDLTPEAQLIMDNISEQAKRRAAELMTDLVPGEPLHGVRESAFCLGYAAGAVDFGAMIREQYGVTFAQMTQIFEAACAWRDGGRASHSARLVAAIDEARKDQS